MQQEWSWIRHPGIITKVVNLSSIRSLDRQGVIQCMPKTGLALTVGEHIACMAARVAWSPK